MHIHKFFSTLTVLVILAGTILVGCGPQSPAAQSGGGTLIYGSPYEPSALNPIVAPDVVTKWILETIFDGLVAINEKMEIVPELATSWEISLDGTVYTFKLRKDVKWHDGKDLTADDVKFTYDAIIDPKQPKTLAKSDYALVDKIEVVDPRTVRFILKGPNAAFLSKLAVGIAPKHLLEGQEAASAAFNRKPIGTGPFKVEEWAAGQKVVLTANLNYFRGRPKLDKLIWQITPDTNVLTVQILNGEVDGGPIINPKDLQKFKEKTDLKIYESVGPNTYIGFNNEKEPFNDKRVRQALNYGLDKKTIIEKIVDGQGVWSTSEILADTWAYNPNVNRYEYDPAKAKTLLDEAGWKIGASGIREKDGKPLKFVMLTNAGDKLREEIALFVRQQWKELGVEMEPQFLELNTFINERVLKSNFEAIFLASSVNVDPDFLSRRWSSAALKTGHNFLRWSDPEVDKLLAQGIATTNQAERKKIYDDVQRIIADESPTVPIYYPKVLWAFKTTVKGLVPSPINIFWNAEQWSY